MPFSVLAEYVLGPKYDLSLVFVGDFLMRRLNRERRNKDKTTNVLSFPLDKNLGEIFMNPRKIIKESQKYDQDFTYRFAYLFIHSLLHLKGYDHSVKMESEEQRVLARFDFHEKKYSNRNRHR